MRREIKFRVWHNNSKKYLDLGVIGNDKARDLTREIIFNPDVGVVERMYNEFDEYLKDFTLEQYTGLKDKNGVEIYEGDILSEEGVTDPEDIFEVVYQDSEARFVLENDYGRGPDLGEWFNKIIIGYKRR